MNYKVQRFRKIVNEMADLYEKKNSNYGDSFGKLFSDLGPISGLVPLHNKLDRLTSLVAKSDKNNFESIEDTLKDLACYAIMNLIEMEKTPDDNNDKKNDLIDDYEWLQQTGYSIQGISIDPCATCVRLNTAWNSTIHPCAGCPHYKEYPYDVTCSSGGSHE